MAKNNNQNDERLVVLGERLREARKAAGVSQEKLAGIFDVHVNTIRNWERGRAACSKHKYLSWYSHHSGYSIDYLQDPNIKSPHATKRVQEIQEFGDKLQYLIAYLLTYHNINFSFFDNGKASDGQSICSVVRTDCPPGDDNLTMLSYKEFASFIGAIIDCNEVIIKHSLNLISNRENKEVEKYLSENKVETTLVGNSYDMINQLRKTIVADPIELIDALLS